MRSSTKSTIVIFASILLLGCNPSGQSDATDQANDEWGEFPTNPKVEALDDGRLLRLLEDFAYVDPHGKVWTARQDDVVNGASIPRVFWSLIGGPFSGKFRNASIVHDTACERMSSSWKAVHQMFYEACRCGGVSETKAKIMYAAVYHFGPRWKLREVSEQRVETDDQGVQRTVIVKRAVATDVEASKTTDEATIEKLKKLVEDSNPSLEQLRNLDPEKIGD